MLVACNATTASLSPFKSDAAGTDSAGGDAAGSPIAETDDAAAGDSEAATTAAWPWDATTAPDAGYPAPMACDVDASPEASITECPPPISTCGSSQDLLYFGWGACVAGWCSWPQMTTGCRWGCSSGGCLAPPTM